MFFTNGWRTGRQVESGNATPTPNLAFHDHKPTMSAEPDDAVRTLCDQTALLAQSQDHITRVIQYLNVPEDAFSDQYGSPNRPDFSFDAVVRAFLYQHARDFSQSAFVKRLHDWPYVKLRLGLSRPPTQQTLSYAWRNRLSQQDRNRITEAARHINTICAQHGLVSEYEPALSPGELDEGVSDDEIRQAVQKASETVFSEFDSHRAENAKYDDSVFFERQAFNSMIESGTAVPKREFQWASSHNDVPHGRTHLRTMKKIANPDPQTGLDAFTEQGRPPDWQRIRDEVLEPFHSGVDRLLEDARTRSDKAGVREPVVAAIDITQWGFHGHPLRDHGDRQDEDRVIQRDGTPRWVRDEFPEMVSGSHKEDHPRAFKFATLTIIARDTPFILAVEPVREESWWEPDGTPTPRTADIVDRLLEQATEHVDIHKVFMDSAFYAGGVQNVVDQHGITYLIPKSKRNSDDKGVIQTVEELPEDEAVRDEEFEDDQTGRSHVGTCLYAPSRQADGEYAVFVSNRDVDPDMAPGLVEQYDQRWEIENQYRAIKSNFLPRCASLDYRLRFLYFVIGCVMQNVWRLANYYLRREVAPDADFDGETPIPAREIVLIVGFAIDPGG